MTTYYYGIASWNGFWSSYMIMLYMYMENRDCNIYFLDKLNQIKYFNSEKKTLLQLLVELKKRSYKRTEAISSIMAKVEMKKNIHLQMWFFLPFEAANSTKTNLRSCNLWTCWNISLKSFDWICPIQLAKSLSDKMAKMFIIANLYLLPFWLLW